MLPRDRSRCVLQAAENGEPIAPGLLLGNVEWDRHVRAMVDHYAFHGLFCNAPAHQIAESISECWPDAEWMADVAEKTVLIGGYDYSTGLDDVAIVFGLKSWPWTIVTGLVNQQAEAKCFDLRVGRLARSIHEASGAEVVAVSNCGWLWLTGGEPERHRNEVIDWHDVGVTNEWLIEHQLFLPPFTVDSVNGSLRIQLSGLSLSEVTRIDVFRGLALGQPFRIWSP